MPVGKKAPVTAWSLSELHLLLAMPLWALVKFAPTAQPPGVFSSAFRLINSTGFLQILQIQKHFSGEHDFTSRYPDPLMSILELTF